MTSEKESRLALTNIHYGRQIGIDAAIDIFARTYPRLVLSERTVNHKNTAFDELCKMLNN